MFHIFRFCDTYPADKVIRWATYASVFIAVVLIALKSLAWWMTHSLSLQASLIDSILDMIASFVNLFAVRTSLEAPDYFHRFGHGKAESLAALFQSVFIAASAVWLLTQVFERLVSPLPLQKTDVGLVVMVIATLLTFCLLIYQNYVVKRTQNEAIRADRLHYYSDILTNGSVFVSLLLVNFLSIEWIDPLFGGFIALYILKTSWDMTYRSINILMDHELPEEKREEIKKIILSFQEVIRIQDFRTRTSGMKQFIQFQLALKNSCSFKEACTLLEKIREKIRRSFPQAETIIQPILVEEEKI